MYKEFDYIEIGGQVNGFFTRNIMCKTEEVVSVVGSRNFTDTYTTIYKYNNLDQNLSDVIAPFYIDLDIDDIENNFTILKRDLHLIYRQLKRKLYLKDEEIEIYFSGSKGFHIIIPAEVLGIEPSKRLNEAYKLLALRLKSFTINKSVDTKIYDKKRLFRLPNTINSKTGLYKIKLTIDELKNITYDELKLIANNPREIQAKQYIINAKAQEAFVNWIEEIRAEEKKTINHKVAREFLKRKELLPCIKYILVNGCLSGNRNNTTNALASALLQLGQPYNEVLETIQSWNSTKNTPPLPGREIETTVLSALKSVEGGRRYGCSSLRMLGVCVKDCPIHK